MCCRDPRRVMCIELRLVLEAEARDRMSFTAICVNRSQRFACVLTSHSTKLIILL